MRTRKDKEIYAYELALEEVPELKFMHFNSDYTKSLLSQDLNIDSGIKFLRNNLNDISILEIDKLFIEDLDASGSESIIYFNPRDDDYIYKINSPEFKIEDSRFNSYIISIMFQELLFPECKYSHFYNVTGIDYPGIFMRQKMFDLPNPLDGIIKRYMTEQGYRFQNNAFYIRFGGVILKISDLNSKNCKIRGNDLLAFDAKFEII